MSPIQNEIDENGYRRLLQRALPHVIRTEEEGQRFSNVFLGLDEKQDASTEEPELAELLTVLIEDDEKRRYPIKGASPRQILQHLLEARGLTQKDLWTLFGSKGLTSEVFSGKRAISKTQAKKLPEFFHLSTALFI